VFLLMYCSVEVN